MILLGKDHAELRKFRGVAELVPQSLMLLRGLSQGFCSPQMAACETDLIALDSQHDPTFIGHGPNARIRLGMYADSSR